MTHTSRVPPGSDDCDRSWAKDRSDARGLGGCLPLVAAGAVIRRRAEVDLDSNHPTLGAAHTTQAGVLENLEHGWALVPRLCDELPDPFVRAWPRGLRGAALPPPMAEAVSHDQDELGTLPAWPAAVIPPNATGSVPASRTNATWEPSITSVPCGASLVREPASKERERSSAAHASAASLNV